MTFTSLDFVVFLAALLPVYWLVPRRTQNIVLLAASWFFYGYAELWLVGLLAWSVAATYVATNAIARDPIRRRLWMWVGVAANLGVLFGFKYFNAAVAVSGAFGTGALSRMARVALPVGLSFYSLQCAGYVFDVYDRRVEARRNVIDVALFTSFFPLILAGPIERAGHLLPQIECRRNISPDAVLDGLVLVLWGFFKKLVIADHIGVMADKVFALQDAGFVLLWSGVFAFAIQLYADFSAYSDIARGVARWFGFELPVNFNHPYIATSLQEFWRRWHISLSSWLRDYVFFPLAMAGGGTRTAAVAAAFATFVVSGVWHGATWSFVVWGLYHAAMIVSERALEGRLPRVLQSAPVRGVTTFVIVCVGWLIFREPELSRIAHDLTLLPWSDSATEVRAGLFIAAQTALYSAPLWAAAALPALGWWPDWNRSGSAPGRLQVVRTLTCAALFAGVLIGAAPASFDFIYLRF